MPSSNDDTSADTPGFAVIRLFPRPDEVSRIDHSVVCARRHGENIVTSNPVDLRAPDPDATLSAL